MLRADEGDTRGRKSRVSSKARPTAASGSPRSSGYFRPFPGYAHYRSPVKQLYMTGPHCHPGGGISAMGTITARVMLDDMGLKPANF